MIICKEDVESEACVEYHLAPRRKKYIPIKRQKDPKCGKGVVPSRSCDHSCSEGSSESVSCSKPEDLTRMGPEAGTVLLSHDSGNYIWNGGRSGLVPDVSNSLFRPPVSSSVDGHIEADFNTGGVTAVKSINLCKLISHSGLIQGPEGAPERGLVCDSGPACSGTVLKNCNVVSGSLPKHCSGNSNGGRGGGKIRKVVLNREDSLNGKGRLNAKTKEGKSSKVPSKGMFPLVNMAGRGICHSGSLSTCYGEQSEESDIRRNNGRQWDFLKRDVGDRLLEAIVSLGVVDIEGRNTPVLLKDKLIQGRDMVRGGRKEVKNIVQ